MMIVQPIVLANSTNQCLCTPGPCVQCDWIKCLSIKHLEDDVVPLDQGINDCFKPCCPSLKLLLFEIFKKQRWKIIELFVFSPETTQY